MDTDDFLRPFTSEVAHLMQGFGQNIIARGRLQYEEFDEKFDEKFVLTTLQRDLKKAGALGMLSFIRALIISGPFTRNLLLRQAGGLCGEALMGLFEELLDEFEGPDPLRDCWNVTSDGYYRVNVTY